jgi:hypothetical protein
MKDIIDLPEQESDNPIYLKKSAKLYKIYGGLFIFSIIVSVFVRPILDKNRDQSNDLLDLLVWLPVLSVFVLAPLGLFYSWKSHKRKEGLRKNQI